MQHRKQSRRSGQAIAEHVVTLAIIAFMMALLAPAVREARDNARPQQCRNNLTHLSYALHQYHETNNFFPPATINPGAAHCDRFLNGAPIRNHTAYLFLLPYIDQAPLYHKIDFTKPSGNARHTTGCTASVGDTWPNFVTANRVIPLFLCPTTDKSDTPYTSTGPGTYSLKGAQRTTYGLPVASIEQGDPDIWAKNYDQVTDISKSAWWHNGAARISEIEDGRSNTLMLIETPARKHSASFGPFWNQYAHTMYIVPSRGINIPHPTLPPQPYVYAWGAGSSHTGGAFALMADGNVRFLNQNISTPVLKAMVSIKGGDVVDQY